MHFGDLHDCGLETQNWETAKTMLDEYMQEFEKRNPNLKVFNAVMHLDESTPHLHIDFVPVAHKGQRGMPLKNSMSGALREQGFSSSNKMQNEWTAWSESERSVMEQILLKHGLRREFEDMSKKAGADFVPVSIYSPDKLQYIADGLARAKIPCVAESNTLYVPDYALKTAKAIASHYKPDEKAPTIREQIKLDIDRLVYRTETLDDLLYRLQERGYEVKDGKYISVKHPSAERFVRLKNLGDEYLPKNLEQRIAEKDRFTDCVREKVKSATTLEKRFHITILNVASAVKQFRLEPKKTDKRRYYFFQNDARINYLSEQLVTIGEFGLTSRDSIYAKAQELQRTIHQKRSQGANPEEQEKALKRINTLIKAYEEIVEGNYIDNLIKAQQEEKQAAQQNTNGHKSITKKAQKR